MALEENPAQGVETERSAVKGAQQNHQEEVIGMILYGNLQALRPHHNKLDLTLFTKFAVNYIIPKVIILIAFFN